MSAAKKPILIQPPRSTATDQFSSTGERIKCDFASLLLLLLNACNLFHPSVNAQVMEYDITASRASMADLNSSEQTLGRVYCSNSPYHFRISVALTNYQIPNYNPLRRSYRREFLPFLAATGKVVTNDVNLTTLSQQLWPSDGNVAVYLTNSLNWVATNILYDSELATKLGNGESDTRSSADVLTLRKGTCSEYANLFIALMRYRNIPAAYITGYAFKYGYHAWAEVYLDSAGWVSVDPQGGTIGISTGHIKLFRSADFPAIQTKLGEIKIKATVIDE
jgi:transglutaminase superfamily protein